MYFIAEATADPPLENHIDGSNIIEISVRNDLDDAAANNENRVEEQENPEAAAVAGGGGAEQN
jgi:hypothetical protein